jgi:alanyl-tRNA synthetase
MKTLHDIRSTFIDFFKKNNHEHVISSPLIPNNDPTLLFTNAGMVQFKDVFTGLEKKSYSKATTSQKCLRAGGKHNDLDNVGYTARHHTFFEMLGNFSFGDYFKQDAIDYAWKMVTQNFGLSPNKLWVTVYHDDDEAAAIWKKVSGFSDERIIRIDTNDNFWSMGDTGPCGPCSEIFYDHGDHIPGGLPGSPDQDGDRFIEIWNLVFMQYDQQSSGERLLLPKPSIDTGMGLERVSAILQGVHNNYDVDIFKILIQSMMGILGNDQSIESYRVIADHIRSMCFLIADGVLPSNEGRGYVLRRIMRRAMRHVYLLGGKDPALYQLVPILCKLMGDTYPELIRAQSLMSQTIKLEEERFQSTLDRGMKLLDDEVKKLGSSTTLSGEVAFKLYDTYGFPIDLTADILKSTNHTVDESGFETAMTAQKTQARQAWSGSGDKKQDDGWFQLKNTIAPSEFVGYETLTHGANVLALTRMDLSPIDSMIKEGEEGYLITDKTPFYAESGGQVGDTGTITTAQGDEAIVLNTFKRVDSLIVHHIKVTNGYIKSKGIVTLTVDAKRRSMIKSNHSATHLLHAALRSVLGDHVTQKGSLVDPHRLRFDFSHSVPLKQNEIEAIQLRVNESIALDLNVNTSETSPEKAIEQGALALFGERYGDSVRVIKMDHASTELCGGTHVNRTSQIGIFKIIHESGIASGVRRIEAVTGMNALTYLEEKEHFIQELSTLMKCAPRDLMEKTKTLLKKSNAPAPSSGNTFETHQENNMPLWISKTNAEDCDLKAHVDMMKNKVQSGICVAIQHSPMKVSIVIGITSDFLPRLNAVDLVKQASIILGGRGGGGRADLAQAGGTDPSQINAAIQAIKEAI